jgi:integrase/recombinase XerD
MKNDEATSYYESVFAAHMADFIRYKRAQGLKYDAVPLSLRSFSRFLSAKKADEASIGKELIEEWCSFRPNENRHTQTRRIVETTQFLKYLSERGMDVHLPRPTRNLRRGGAFVPHIFSHKELRRFFEECDRISARTPSMMPVMLPVLFRLLLGCGLRISEALGLRLGDTDLDKGILVIRQTKFNKDRLIPLSDSLLAVLRGYSATYHKISRDDKDPFFAHRDGRVVSRHNIYTWFRKLVWAAGISHGGRGNGPRVHDFRHTFSVYSLKAMTDKGMDIYCALPLLSTYLGHASVSATGQYVRLTQDMFPEIIEKVNAIAAFVIPRGERQ